MVNRVYARPGWKLARQLGGDSFVLAWVAGWGLAGRWVAQLVEKLAGPARVSGEAAASMAGQMEEAHDRLGTVPGVGGSLAQPFDALAGGLQQIVAQSGEQVLLVHRLAVVAGWLCFLVPALGMLVWWLPRRIRFFRFASAARQVVDADEDLALFALRAMASQPVHVLAGITPDPVGEWRRGNPEVIRELARLELEANGLALPKRLDGSRRRLTR